MSMFYAGSRGGGYVHELQAGSVSFARHLCWFRVAPRRRERILGGAWRQPTLRQANKSKMVHN